jgi:hypothetical protein
MESRVSACFCAPDKAQGKNGRSFLAMPGNLEPSRALKENLRRRLPHLRERNAAMTRE